MSKTDHREWLEELRRELEAEIDRRLSLSPIDYAGDPARVLREATRYAVLGPGKRLRPALVLAASEAVGGDRRLAMAAAAAVEMLHAYTLVHDDLPAMDDDDERRGRPTVHVRFGEATAILAGDALLTEAFVALADLGVHAAAAVRVLGQRAGTCELLAGQIRDLDAERSKRKLSWDELDRIHRGKTGALFSAAAELGGIAAGADAATRARLAEFGMTVGVAFQHGDDKLDAEHQGFRDRAEAEVRVLAARASELAADFGEAGNRLAAVVEWIALR